MLMRVGKFRPLAAMFGGVAALALAAGGDRGLCRGQHRARVGLDHGLNRRDGRQEHVLHSVPVHRRAHIADAGLAGRAIAWDVARNLFGISVGTAAMVGFGFASLTKPMRIAFGTAVLAILIPPTAFAGAHVFD